MMNEMVKNVLKVTAGFAGGVCTAIGGTKLVQHIKKKQAEKCITVNANEEAEEE